MSDAEDDYFGTADGDDPEDDGGYGYCPHVEDYGYCLGSACRPIDNEFGTGGDDDHAPTSTMASFGQPGTGKSSHGLFQFMTSKHMSPGRAYMLGMDPASPDGEMVVMVDEASALFADVARKGRKAGVYLDWATRQYPSLKKFVEQYSTFVPHGNNNPKEKYTMDMSGIAKMRGELEEMLAKFTGMVAIVERFGGEPGDGTVIKFEHSFEADFLRNEAPKVYNYVAVRRFGKWYVSGRPFGGKAIKWAELLEFIGDGRAWICSEFTEVPVPGASASSADQDKATAVAGLIADMDGQSVEEVAAKVIALLDESK